MFKLLNTKIITILCIKYWLNMWTNAFFFQIDHLARARRSKEIPFLEKQFDDEHLRSREFWEQQEVERVGVHLILMIHL